MRALLLGRSIKFIKLKQDFPRRIIHYLIFQQAGLAADIMVVVLMPRLSFGKKNQLSLHSIFAIKWNSMTLLLTWDYVTMSLILKVNMPILQKTLGIDTMVKSMKRVI